MVELVTVSVPALSMPPPIVEDSKAPRDRETDEFDVEHWYRP